MNAHRLPPREPGPRGWLTRVLAAVGAAGALIVSFFLGALVFVTALGLFLLLAIGVAIRIWWLRRQFRDHMDAWERGEGAAGGEDVIDAEYTVVERRERKHGERHEE